MRAKKNKNKILAFDNPFMFYVLLWCTSEK